MLFQYHVVPFVLRVFAVACRSLKAIIPFVVGTAPGTKLAMSVADNFDIRRNAYWWASVYFHEVTWHGEQEGCAVWCAFNYVDRLVGIILRRKAKVDEAVAEQTAIRDSMPKDAPPPPVDPPRPGPPPPTGTIAARLVNAFSGQVYWTVQMSKWAIIGDAVSKANWELDISRRAARGFRPDDAPENINEYWQFCAADETWSRNRFHAVLTSGQESMDVAVVKRNFAATIRRDAALREGNAPPLQAPGKHQNT